MLDKLKKMGRKHQLYIKANLHDEALELTFEAVLKLIQNHLKENSCHAFQKKVL